MWYWEVIYQVCDETHSFYSLKGTDTYQEASVYFDSLKDRVLQEIKKKNGKVIDVQIVYKSSDKLY
jgi:hypothetical protein